MVLSERNNTFMKILFSVLKLNLVILFASTATLFAQSAVDPYSLLSRTILPIASVFSPQSSQHGLSATLVLEQMTDLPPEQAGARVEIALQPPDRALIRGPLAGEPTTLCRVGQGIWFSPGSKIQAMLGPVEEAPKPKKKNKNKGIAPLALPFAPQQLVLLPALFVVKDEGEEAGLRILDVRLMPELARGLGIEEWHARIGVDAEAKPVRIEVARPGWHVIARVEHLEFAPSLPPATWDAPAGDVARTSGRQAKQWLEAIASRMNPTGTGAVR